MCGEKGQLIPFYVDEVGSPPHVRGKGFITLTYDDEHGITPACAGKRMQAFRFLHAKWDHPRMCGEKRIRWKNDRSQ